MPEEINPLVEAGGQEVDPQVGQLDQGQHETQNQQIEEPPRNFLDPNEVADRYVRVKIDGEEVEVPFGEALQGYSRTADYTRKTQQLAQQRQEAEFGIALQRALQANPEATIQLLAQQMGVSVGQAAQAVHDQGYDTYDYDQGQQDPYEPKFQSLEQRLQRFEQAQAQQQARAQLDQAVNGLKDRYNLDDATVKDVVRTALERRQGPQAFDSIYKEIAFDRAMAKNTQYRERQAQEDQRRQTGVQQMRGSVHNGGSAAGAPQGAPAADPNRRVSLSEAFESAWAGQG